MQVIVLGDSLSFPRHHKGQRWQDSWPKLVESIGECEVWHRSRQASSVKEMVREAAQLVDYVGSEQQFDLVVYQLGIVDATPRPYSRWFNYNHSRIPFGTRFHRHINRNYGGYLRIRKRPWISPKQFSQRISVLAEFGFKMAKRVAFVGIAPAANHLAEKSPLIGPSIEKYNNLMRSEVESLSTEYEEKDGIVSYIDPYRGGGDEQLTLPDGVHMTNEGHRILAEMVVDLLPNRD